jgi:hypothetical protein
MDILESAFVVRQGLLLGQGCALDNFIAVYFQFLRNRFAGWEATWVVFVVSFPA